jgi:hypothetical protein
MDFDPSVGTEIQKVRFGQRLAITPVNSVMNETVRRALDLWNAGRATEAGELLCTQIPDAVRPFWAARILDACRRHTKFPLAVRVVSVIAKRRFLWRWGHVAFGEVRRLTLQWDEATTKDEVYGGLLCLAENVAKVTYNATNPRDPFDEDAGAWVVSCLRFIANKVHDPEFEAKAWQLASRTEV